MKELTEVRFSHRGLFSLSQKTTKFSKVLQSFVLPLALGALAVCGAATAPSAQAVTLNWSAVKEPGIGGAVTSIEVCPADSNKIVVGGDMLGATYSTDGGATWNDSFGLTNWECADATWAPGSTSTIWIGTMGGPFKSIDGGRNWVAKRSGMPAPETYWGFNVPIQNIIFDPNNSLRMLAFGGSHRDWSTGKSTAKMGSVWESTNGGESWTQKAVIADGGAGVGGDVMTAEFASGSSTIVYAATRNSGVYRSNDGGATWTAKNSGLPTTTTDFIAVHPTSASTLWWCGVGKRAVYKSTEGGDSWSFSGSGLGFDTVYDHLYRMITVSPANSNVLYVSNANWESLYKSTDGGANWSNVAATLPPTPTGLYVQGVWTEIDPNNANTVYTCNSVTIFKSTDAGANWTNVSSKTGSSTGLWQGKGYSGYVSTKIKWNPLNTNQVVLQAMDDGKFMSSTDNLLNWKMRGTGMNQWSGGNDVTFGGTGGSTIYVALGQWGADGEAPARSTDGGASWTYLANPGSGVSQSIYTLPSDTTKVWLIRSGRLYYSSNSGSSWAEINVDNNTTLSQIVGDNASPPNIYIAAQNGAYKGSASNSFTRAATVEWSNAMHIALDPSKTGRFYLAAWLYNQYNCGIYRVDNGTQTRIGGNLYSYVVAVDPQNANRVVMVTNHDPGVEISQATGVWMTENALDATPIWTQQNTGLPMLRGKAIAIHPTNGTIIVGLNGRGFYKSNTSCAAATPTGTGIGLNGQYFNDRTLTSLVRTQTDAQVNFDWGVGQPQSGGANMSGIGSDNFSVRWSGQVQAIEAGTYTFTVTADDGVRLTLNGATSPQIDRWILQGPTSYSTTHTLTAGQKIDVKMEYFEQTGGATAKLLWTRPGGISVAIPQAQLYSAPTSSVLVNRATGGTASASSAPMAGEGAAQAFDGSTNTKWLGNQSNPSWLQYTFPLDKAYTITQYRIASANDAPGRDPKNWTLQGSNDNWTTLTNLSASQINQTFGSRNSFNGNYSVSNSTAYKSYRLNITANSGDGLVQLSELELLGAS